jgi:hypothetical protein
MSEVAGLEVVAAPAVGAAEAPEVESFDRQAALAEARSIMGADEEPATPEPDTEEETAEKPEAKPEEAKPDDEDDKTKKRREKLSDEEGKLKQDKLDAAFAKLTAEGRRLRSKVEAFKAEKATFDTAKAQYDSAVEQAAQRVMQQEQEFNTRKDRARKEPLAAFEELGWTVEKLVKFIQNDGKHTPEDLIEKTRSEYDQRIQEQEARLEELNNSIKKGRFEQAAKSYETRAVETMRELLPKYELVSKFDLQTEIAPKVLQNIAHIYREGGVIDGVQYPKGTALDPKTILDYFEKQESAALSRYGFRPGQAGATASVAKPGAAQPKPLSNADTSSRSVKTVDDDAAFDREAALAEAMRMLQ